MVGARIQNRLCDSLCGWIIKVLSVKTSSQHETVSVYTEHAQAVLLASTQILELRELPSATRCRLTLNFVTPTLK